MVRAADVPDDLVISLSGPLQSAGNVGGSFPSQSLLLINNGHANLAWTAAKTQPWLDLSPSSGTLAPRRIQQVTISFNAAANTLSVGHYSDTLTFTNLTSGVSQTSSLGLSIQPPSFLRFSLDADPGWSRTGEWAFGHPMGGGGAAHGFPDPSNGATGTNVFGINLSGDYDIAYPSASYLTAGPFNLTGVIDTRLQFQKWLNVSPWPAVKDTVEVSRDGTTWTTLWSNDFSETSAKTWTKVQSDISKVADNQPAVYIRWGHQITSNVGVLACSGWNIDDVDILGVPGATAPSIVSQPQSQTAEVGSTVVFSVGATGSPAPTFQWSFNGAPIAGATSSSYTLTNLQIINAGAYAVTVSNRLGSVTSSVATLSGTALPPMIIAPPTNLLVTAGENATFTVAATGTPPLIYQWRRNGFPITGATGSSFTLPSASRTDADYYDVMVGAGLTVVTSSQVRLSVAPTPYVTSVTPDPKWNLQLEADTPQGYAVAPLSDGRSYIAGAFTSVNGSRHTGIARVNADGVTLDSTFAAPEVDNAIHFVAVQEDGKILIAGEFLRVGGILRPHLARLNPDGSFDPTFVRAIAESIYIEALTVQTDGRILVAGAYRYLNHGGARSFATRLNRDGSPDSTFLALGVDDSINAVLLQGDGRILVGGAFTHSVDINGMSENRAHLIRLNNDGTVDTSFVAVAPDFAVKTLAFQSDGKLLAGGAYDAKIASPAYNLVRFNVDGSLDPTFTSRIDVGFNALAVQADGKILTASSFPIPGPGSAWYDGLVRLNSDGSFDGTFPIIRTSTISQFALQANGQLLIAGDLYSFINGNFDRVLRSSFARINPDGSLDNAFNFSIRSAGEVFALLPLPQGKMLLSGRFGFVRGQPTASSLIRLNADATVDPTFNPGGAGPSQRVLSAVAQPDGKIVIAGWFWSYNGVEAQGIARLNTDGTLDQSFHPSVGFSGGNTLALLPGGRIFIGGAYVVGTMRFNSMAVMSADGKLDATFGMTKGGNFGVWPLTSIVQPDGKIIIGGHMWSYDGVAVGGIVRLNPDGTLDPTFVTGLGFDGGVYALALQPDGKILAGGFFFNFDGINRRGLARLNSDGTLDLTFVPSDLGFGLSSVSSLLAQEDGRVVVSGEFPSADGAVAASHLIRLNSDGSRDTTFVDGGFNNPGGILIMGDNGQLAMQSAGVESFTVTRSATAPMITSSPLDKTVAAGSTATFAVTASSVLPLSYQWLYNDTPLAGATQASLTLTNVQAAQAGNYRVVVSSELGSTTSGAAALTLLNTSAVVTLGGLAQTFDGTPRSVSVTTAPAGLPVVVTYNGSTSVPTHAGSYAVTATVTDPVYRGSAVGTLTVAKANAIVTLGAQTAGYTGTPKAATAITTPAGLYLNFTYDGGATPPTNAGSYIVRATIDDSDYTGTGSGTLTITPAPATITLGSLTAIYDGTPKSVQAVTSPSGLNVALTYNGSATDPTNAGSYSVAASILDPNYTGTAGGTLAIAKAAASVTLEGLTVRYDGTPKPVTVTTTPSEVATEVTYNGSTTPPIYPGTYTVVATIVDGNYTGSLISNTLTVGVTALVRHAPVVDGGLDGSLQVLLPENVTLNSPSWISGDLLMPGAPLPVVNGQPIFTGTIEGIGSAVPSNYQVTLNEGVTLRYLVRRVDPIALPSVGMPPVPTGTRDVTATSSRTIGSFATLRNLTLVAPAGLIVIPPGTYGIFTAQRSSGFILGSTSATTPSIYNLQGLNLNDASQLVILGPVIVNVANGISIQVPSSIGSDADPEWLVLNVASGNVTLRGTLFFNGFIVAPASTVAVQGGATLIGGVISDRLTIDSTSFLGQPAQ